LTGSSGYKYKIVVREDCLTYGDKTFEDIMNEFIILLRPYPTVQSCLAGLNSRYAGMLNNLINFIIR
jgi:hypothetical protein